MGKDKEIKVNFQLTNVSQYYRWFMEMPIVLSKCKLPPRTSKMANAQFTAYFNAGDAEDKRAFIEKINQCKVLLEIQYLILQQRKLGTYKILLSVHII